MPSKEENRLKEVFGCREVPQVSKKALNTYRNYLKKHLTPGCLITGQEDFLWEEYYILGPGDQEEYEELKRDNPSYTDNYRLIDILPKVSLHNDLLAHVERITDGKHFEIELSWLEAIDKKSQDSVLLKDFGVWQVNWQ